MGTNCYKVIVMGGIIKFRKSCTFSWMKKDTFISFIVHKRKLVGGALPRPYSRLSLDFLPLSHCQFVAAVVFGVGGMALDPVVVEFVLHS